MRVGKLALAIVGEMAETSVAVKGFLKHRKMRGRVAMVLTKREPLDLNYEAQRCDQTLETCVAYWKKHFRWMPCPCPSPSFIQTN